MTMAVSCGQTDPQWYDSGLNPPSSDDIVRSPNASAMPGAASRPATWADSSRESRPVPSRWPMLLVRELTGRLSRSRASAGKGPWGPSTQKAARKRSASAPA